jgi:hypothetical protein
MLHSCCISLALFSNRTNATGRVENIIFKICSVIILHTKIKETICEKKPCLLCDHGSLLCDHESLGDHDYSAKSYCCMVLPVCANSNAYIFELHFPQHFFKKIDEQPSWPAQGLKQLYYTSRIPLPTNEADLVRWLYQLLVCEMKVYYSVAHRNGHILISECVALIIYRHSFSTFL